MSRSCTEKSLFCQCCDFSEHKKTVTNEVKKKKNKTILLIPMRNAWILTCRLMPKNCQTWRLWYLYLDGTMLKYGGPVPMFQAQELGQIRSTRTLSHERTMNLMRFGSVVIKSADLSRALETITMPLGMWLKDLLVNKRASLEDFRNWRCLLVTLYCSCCTANCKEKNNTYNIPEEKKKI